MIHAYRSYGAYQRDTHISSIQSSSKANLYHSKVNIPVSEIKKCARRYYLKFSWMITPFFSHLIYCIAYSAYALSKILIRNIDVVYLYPLIEFFQIGRCVEAYIIPLINQHAVYERACGTLSICASYMNYP